MIVQTPLVVGVQGVAPKPALFKVTGREIEVDPEDAVNVTEVDREAGAKTLSGCATPTIALAVATYGVATGRLRVVIALELARSSPINPTVSAKTETATLGSLILLA